MSGFYLFILRTVLKPYASKYEWENITLFHIFILCMKALN
ncbi:hypothetical protein bcere0009_32970 [Bacillus cereus R309803]|nr:hypothetical protein bcere0009_32970 [Bacillus cereus R309803]